MGDTQSVPPRKSTTSRSTARKSSASRSQPPDAIALLKRDHRDVEALFSRFEGLGAKAQKTRRSVVDRISEALSVHAAIEEEVLYPAIRAALPDAEDEVLEALEEHHLVKTTLAELERVQPENERFTPKVMVLMENVRHHVREEERDLFPKVRKAMSAGELRELGDRLRQAKQTAPTRPHPHAPDTPPGNVVVGVLTAPLDAAANLAESAANRVRDIVG